ncbi:hypothetical protein V6N12_058107 [Hibiscus sabdariffa]|uniref:Uncharacterized protein n=1 Tax=Hibiscus sabdariffa TaxID=183260 RepID=A0ABR2BPS7_9ROSI
MKVDKRLTSHMEEGKENCSMEKGVWLQREMLKTFNEMHPLRPDRYGVVAAAAIRKQAAKPSKCTKRSPVLAASFRKEPASN